MQTDEDIMIAYGMYKTIKPHQYLAFTWRWKGTEMDESLVTISFIESGDGTEMTLHHVTLPSKESIEHHTVGWNGSIEKLTEFSSQA